MPKTAFWVLHLSIKCSRSFPSDLKTDQEEVSLARKTVKGYFEILKIPTILHLLLLVSHI